MTPQRFRHWVARTCAVRQITRAQLAKRLGISRQALLLYCRGARYDGTPRPVPLTVQLAMNAVDMGFHHYEPARARRLAAG